MPKALKQKQEYGIPLSRYTVFLQNCPLGHDPKANGFFQRCVPLARNVMCPSGVMLTSSVMCASRVSRAERITSLCTAGAIHHCASAQHHCGGAATSLFDSKVFRNFVDAFRAFRVCRQIRTGETVEMFTRLWYKDNRNLIKTHLHRR